MPIRLSRLRIVVAKIVHDLVSLRADQRGTVAVMMGFLLPILVGGMGLGFEISNWYSQSRAMQNAADSAAISAAANAGSNYDVEAKAVAAQYGFVDGSKNVTVTASNTATCPAGGNTCYSVTISSVVPLYLSQVVGYTGDTKLNGASIKTLTSASIAQQGNKQQPICLLALGKTGTALRSNGGPNTNFTGCTVMSDSAATCNGSNLQATYGLAAGSNSGCGITQYSNIPAVSDPYASYASNIPSQNTLANASHCNNSYPQESKHGQTWSGGTAWSAGTKTLTGSASVAGNTLICGDLRLTGNVTIDAPAGAVLYIQNGLLDLQGYKLSTNSGSAVSIVFTGTNSDDYNHTLTDNSGGSSGVLDIEAPKTGPFPGMALYQDPNLTTNVDISYAGNSPTWDITGLTYFPNASVTLSGAINKSAYGAVCMVMVAKDITINGTGSIYAQTPDGSGCKDAGLNMPTATIPGRAKLVY
jgi:Flp pilus assembly protein TadG